MLARPANALAAASRIRRTPREINVSVLPASVNFAT
jgi:hypothetical protein